jgi:hypothetical protein
MLELQSIFCFFCVRLLVSFVHPIHVSVAEIEMDEKDKRLEIMMRVFTDDLELSLRKATNQPELDVLSLSEKARDEIVSSYLKNHFKISLDGKAQKITYLGHEQEDPALIFYIEVPNVKKWKTIQIQDDIITEIHADQSNLVHVTVREKIRSLRLTKNNPVDKLTFDF